MGRRRAADGAARVKAQPVSRGSSAPFSTDVMENDIKPWAVKRFCIPPEHNSAFVQAMALTLVAVGRRPQTSAEWARGKCRRGRGRGTRGASQARTRFLATTPPGHSKELTTGYAGAMGAFFIIDAIKTMLPPGGPLW